jgi:hypothetical protein
MSSNNPNIQQSAKNFKQILAQNLVQQVVNGIVAENHPDILKHMDPNQ